MPGTARRAHDTPTPGEIALWAEAFRNTAYGIAVGDASTNTIIAMNPALAALLGRHAHELIGRPIADVYAPGAHAIVLEAIRKADRTGDAHYEAEMLRADGTTEPVEVDMRVLHGADGVPLYRVATVRSIRRRLDTERKERELYRRMRALARRLETAREGERRRVAEALHEGLMQQLAALNLELGQLKHRVADASQAETNRASIERLQDRVRAITQSARETIHDFHAAALGDLGLWAVVEHGAAEWGEAAGVQVRCDFAAQPGLAPDVALAAYRAVQECLANVARHARAKTVRLSSRRTGRRVLLAIDDDGVGVEPADLEKPESLGLFGVTERIAVVGGETKVERRAPRGTRVSLLLPLVPATRKKNARVRPSRTR